MKTKEFIRIRLDASPNAVRAWLESAAASAQQIDERSFCVSSLEIDAVTPVEPSQHQRRYGIFSDFARSISRSISSGASSDDGVLVLTADLHCPQTGATVLELRRDEAFPLVAEELMLWLEERFPGAHGDVLAEKPRTRAGAPPLACNVWLEEQLRLLPDHARYHHLYPAWLAHYITLRGYEPLDPRRSFRAAARGCLDRLCAGNSA